MLDPLTDPRWPVFLERNADASIFHTPGWLEALRRTYSYEPVVYTTCPPGEELTNGIPFCRVESWVTGRRFVSLPFSDHCVPLVDTRETLCTLLAAAAHDSIGQGGKYVEIRPLSGDVVGNLLQHNSFGKSSSFYFHWIDLTPSIDEIYATFHRTSVKQMIRRAEKEGLTYNQGTSNELLAQFYRLLILTRRKHRVPLQPFSWFRNLIQCLGSNIRIRIACKDKQPVVAIITCSVGGTHFYKYGSSDPQFTNLGGTALLIWKAIQDAKEQGTHRFDMGRCDITNSGLAKFKERWGATRAKLEYYRTPPPKRSDSGLQGNWKGRLAGNVFAWLPDKWLVLAGRILYKHMG
jgi:hypothetical protein